MADGLGLCNAVAAEPDPLPDPEEEQPDLEEEGERETGAGAGDSDEEEEVDVDGLASFLEFEILCGSSDEDPLDQEEEGEEEEEKKPVRDDANRRSKRKQDSQSSGDGSGSGSEDELQKRARREKGKGKALTAEHPQIDTGMFTNVPVELFLQIFKFLSSEDLISCALVCRFMNAAASDETLWRRLYCMRWGLSSKSNATSNAKLRDCAWKNLYIQVNDDKIILDKTVADQVSSWKSRRGLTDDAVKGHSCSGSTCLYTQIGDAYICEKTGRVHVCDDACREFVLDQSSGLLVCTISGHCFERFLCPDDEWDTCDTDQQQGGVTDEAEPFMGSGRFARAYQLGYDCADEKELEHALRFC